MNRYLLGAIVCLFICFVATGAVLFGLEEDEPVHIKYTTIKVPESVLNQENQEQQPILLEATINIDSQVMLENLGLYKVTYYCSCKSCCGKDPNHPAYGVTRSGAIAQEGVTVAADTSKIPLGSYIYIEGVGFRIVQDTGSLIKGNRIDVYVSDHQEALELGVTTNQIYLLEGGQ